MPFLSSAQFVLVLWLLLAAAPMATVLLNGSVVVFAPAAEVTRTAPAQATEQGGEVSAVAARPRREIAAGRGAAVVFAAAGLATGELAAASVVETALQRHRPRLA
jgi:uncharacterized protein (DUF58 family)